MVGRQGCKGQRVRSGRRRGDWHRRHPHRRLASAPHRNSLQLRRNRPHHQHHYLGNRAPACFTPHRRERVGRSLAQDRLSERAQAAVRPASTSSGPSSRRSKSQYDEWLIRVICSAFSIPPAPWIVDHSRATAQTIQMTAAQEGIRPLKDWIKDAMDDIIQRLMGFGDLEFVWSGDDEIDPLEKAKETEILISCGVKTRAEARTEYGLDPTAEGDLPQLR